MLQIMKPKIFPMRDIQLNQILHALSICLVCSVLFACKGGGDHPEPPQPDKDKTTVIGLILGDNSLTNFVKSDIDEMCIGLEEVDLDENNLILYVDDRTSNLPSIISFKQSETDRSKVVPDTIYSYAESYGSADPEVLKDALRRIITTYPAESYGMILWSHGQGWLPTASTVVEEYTNSTRYFGQDQNGDGQDWMNISDLQQVIEYGQGLLGGNKKFDYLYFDACFMANIETAYQLRHVSDYYIGCVAETPGPGGNYDALVPIMFNMSNNRATRMAEAYDLAYNDPNGFSGWSYGAQISVFDNSKMDAFANECKAVFSNTALAQSIQAIDLNANEIQHFGQDPVSRFAYYDFNQIVSTALTSNEYSSLEYTLEALIVYNARPSTIYSNPLGSPFSMEVNCGLAAYFPQFTQDATVGRYNNYFATYDWAKDTQITSWYPLINYQ